MSYLFGTRRNLSLFKTLYTDWNGSSNVLVVSCTTSDHCRPLAANSVSKKFLWVHMLYLLSFERFSLPPRSCESYFSPHARPCANPGVGLVNQTIYRGKFSKSSIGVPIAAVAGSNGQSALPLVEQVGASRDLSEATRRGAVRALWGTVTHTAAGPFSFSDSVHFIDCRPFHRAEFFARLWSICYHLVSVSPRETSTTAPFVY